MNKTRNRHTGRVNAATQFMINNALLEPLSHSDTQYHVYPTGYVHGRLPSGAVAQATKATYIRVR